MLRRKSNSYAILSKAMQYLAWTGLPDTVHVWRARVEAFIHVLARQLTECASFQSKEFQGFVELRDLHCCRTVSSAIQAVVSTSLTHGQSARRHSLQMRSLRYRQHAIHFEIDRPAHHDEALQSSLVTRL